MGLDASVSFPNAKELIGDSVLQRMHQREKENTFGPIGSAPQYNHVFRDQVIENRGGCWFVHLSVVDGKSTLLSAQVKKRNDRHQDLLAQPISEALASKKQQTMTRKCFTYLLRIFPRGICF